MDTFKNIWEALAGVDNKKGLVLEDWSYRLGAEYSILQPALKSTDCLSDVYPCPLRNAMPNCPGMKISRISDAVQFIAHCHSYNDIVWGDATDIVMEQCGTVHLSRQQILLHTFDLCSFWKVIARSMADENSGLIFHEPSLIDDNTVYVGCLQARASIAVPVFFTSSSSSGAITGSADAIKKCYKKIVSLNDDGMEDGYQHIRSQYGFVLLFSHADLVHVSFASQMNSAMPPVEIYVPLDNFLGFQADSLILVDDLNETLLSPQNGLSNVGLTTGENSDDNDDIDVQTSIERTTVNSFVQKPNNIWTITFDGISIEIKESRGLQRLLFLVRYPGDFFYASDIVNIHRNIVPKPLDDYTSNDNETNDRLDIHKMDGTDTSQADNMQSTEVNRDNDNINNALWHDSIKNKTLYDMQPPNSQPILDQTAIRQIKTVLKEKTIQCRSLSKESQEYTTICNEIKQINKILREALTPTGTIRNMKGRYSKDIKAVRKSIMEDLLPKLRDSHSSLFQHFNQYLKIEGDCCSYLGVDTEWDIKTLIA